MKSGQPQPTKHWLQHVTCHGWATSQVTYECEEVKDPQRGKRRGMRCMNRGGILKRGCGAGREVCREKGVVEGDGGGSRDVRKG